MYAIGQSARRGFAENYLWTGGGGIAEGVDELALADPRMEHHAGFGVIPALAVSGGISLLSSIFGTHSGKTTHAQRFLQAQAAGDTATAHLLIDQAYSHAFLESIPDKAEWVQVWQVMLDAADAGNRDYMNAKMGLAKQGTGAGGVMGSPNQPGNTGINLAGIPGGPLGLILLLGVGLMVLRGRPRGRR